MGFFNRMRKAQETNAGKVLDLGDGGVKPPWCPILAAPIVVQLPQPAIELPGGARGQAMQVQMQPIPCWRDSCMFWDRDNPDGPRCGFLSLFDAVLYGDEDDDGEGVPSGQGG